MRLWQLSLALLFIASGSEASDVACEPINIFAAASTTNAIDAIADDYERETACSVTTIFAASGTLARQIESGAPADIFLSANTEWMDWLQQGGKLRRTNRIALLSNDLVLVVPRESDIANLDPTDPASLSDYLGTGRLAIGDPASVPAGRYTAATLRQLGMSGILENKAVMAGSVRVALSWVARAEAPAGIVYRTDAAIEPKVRIAGMLPAPDNHPIIYPLAMIGKVPNSAARAFYDHLQSYTAAAIFADYGFRRIATE